MVRRRQLAWIVPLALLLVGLAVAAGLLARGEPTQSREEALLFRGRSMDVQPRIRPRLHAFGEAVTAEVTVILNRALIKPDSIRVRARFDPYTLIAPEQRTREDEGPYTRLRWMFTLQCLTRDCLPGEPKRIVEFEPGSVDYTMANPTFATRGPARTSGIINWPTIEVASRLDPTAAQEVRWRGETRRLPDPSFRVDPTIATLALLGGAGLLTGLAAVLALPIVPRRRKAVEEIELDERAGPLDRALALLENRTNGAVPDRRRALELVARELAREGHDDLSGRARRLAWSKQPPSEHETASFAGTVRGALAEEPEATE